jgi:putative FmdB family regulatory protein
MPIYEYECSNCRYYLEVIQKLSDARLKKCPSCGKNALKKLISAPVFRLKGSGWYETDFKGDSEQKRNLAGGEKEEAPATAKDAKDAKDGKDAKTGAADTGADAKAGAASEAKSEAAGDSKSSAKSEPKAPSPAAAPTKGAGARKSRATKPAPKRAASKRAATKSPAKAGKRRGRR